ncbi:MAG TPA: hypothetical protein VHZ03_52745 [Trebonia sp.]|nr:hypothetical protein [Trebonia sp.]
MKTATTRRHPKPGDNGCRTASTDARTLRRHLNATVTAALASQEARKA